MLRSADGVLGGLGSILADPRLLKVGVSAGNDATKLETDYDLAAVEGVVDLNDLMAEAMKRTQAPQRRSLATLVDLVLRRSLPKPSSLRISDWERVPLSKDQRHYAALDAFAGLRLAEALEQRMIRGAVRKQQAAAPQSASGGIAASRAVPEVPAGPAGPAGSSSSALPPSVSAVRGAAWTGASTVIGRCVRRRPDSQSGQTSGGTTTVAPAIATSSTAAAAVTTSSSSSSSS